MTTHSPIAARSLAALLAITFASSASAQLADPGTTRLLSDTNGGASVKIDDATGLARFVDVQAPLSVVDRAAPAETKARQFLATYGSTFGIDVVDEQLVLDEVAAAPSGGVRTSFHQVHGGVPVFGARLYVHLDKEGLIRRANGSTLGALTAPTAPALAQREAATIALDAVSLIHGKWGSPDLVVRRAELVVYQEGLLKRVLGEDHLTWFLEVTNGRDIRRMVFVDAIDGEIVDSFDAIHDAKIRVTYDGQSGGYDPASPFSNILWQEGEAETGVDSVDDLHTYAEDTYDFFNNAFGRDSYDGSGAFMRSVHDLPDPTLCPNAFWNGLAAHYCDGVTPDDVVAHEWTHAYTEYTHGLIYAYEPGALNEAYSDIFGELIDILNNDGHPGAKTVRTDDSCGGASSTRWLVGEGASAFGGAIRDMWNPNCFGHPGSTDDPIFFCEEFDNGGVHFNSGVPNHAFALLVDGGSFNGSDITPIGMIKAAHIYYTAMTQYQTPTSGFAAHAESLVASCEDLAAAGTDLANPADGQPSGEIVTFDDCAAIGIAMQATGMRTPNPCDYPTQMDPDAPALTCPAGTELTPLFEDDFESDPTGSWIVANVAGPSADGYTPIDFDWVGDLPDGRSGSAFFGRNPNLGNCADVNQSSLMRLQSPVITLDADMVAPKLTFTHWFSIEQGWDGGNVSLRVNGGPWQLVEDNAFLFNGYPAILNPGTDNPLSGQPGFSGFEAGTLQGLWAESQIDLTGLAAPGDDVEVRFRLGMDGCFGVLGWYVDDVAVQGCAAVCGDGTTFPTEQCDDGNTTDDGNGCDATCQRNDTCGDGVIQDLFETCDDGDAVDTGNGCDATCQRTNICGNGVHEALFEACDDGNYNSDDDCLVGCVLPTCGDGYVQAGVEDCDDGNTEDEGDGCSATCQYNAVCGDGVIQTLFETCDDGDAIDDGNGCSETCQRYGACGDGVVQSLYEACDDGDTANSANGCDATCQRYDVCGDGFIQALFEDCDDGDVTDDGNGCSDTCQRNDTCGDGEVQTLFESCDDGNTDSGDGCACPTIESGWDCPAAGGPCTPICGDGEILGGEACDDSNTEAGDGCNATCTSDESCGNGVVDDDEACDDGNNDSDDGCNASCSSDESCGNGTVDPGEVCDDGNNLSGDGCGGACDSDETCGNGVVDPGEACDDGNTDSGDGCSADCTSTEACGNGIVDPREACDDGNTDDGDGCSAICDSDETCGNGVVDEGEACDDGNTDSGDGCSATCSSDESCGNGIIDEGEDCDDGNADDSDGCTSTCIAEEAPVGGCSATHPGGDALPVGAAALGLVGVLGFRRRRR